jgi:hypothetical protein
VPVFGTNGVVIKVENALEAGAGCEIFDNLVHELKKHRGVVAFDSCRPLYNFNEPSASTFDPSTKNVNVSNRYSWTYAS